MYFLVTNDYGRSVYVNSREINAVLVGNGALFALYGNTTSVLSTSPEQIDNFIQNIAIEDYFLDLRTTYGYGYIINLSAIAYTDEAPPDAIFITFKVGPPIQVDYSHKATIDTALANYHEATGGGSGNGQATTENILQVDHGFSVGELLRFDGTNWVRSQADQDTSSDVYGIVSQVTGPNSLVLTTSGLVTDLTGLTPGVPYYLSPDIPGALTEISPDVSGAVNKPVLLSISNTTALFVNMRGFVIPPPGLMQNDGYGEINFGTGWEDQTEVVITDQLGIQSLSLIKAWLVAIPTVSHGIQDHVDADLTLIPGNIIEDVGFTVYVKANSGTRTGQYSFQWQWS